MLIISTINYLFFMKLSRFMSDLGLSYLPELRFLPELSTIAKVLSLLPESGLRAIRFTRDLEKPGLVLLALLLPCVLSGSGMKEPGSGSKLIGSKVIVSKLVVSSWMVSALERRIKFLRVCEFPVLLLTTLSGDLSRG